MAAVVAKVGIKVVRLVGSAKAWVVGKARLAIAVVVAQIEAKFGIEVARGMLAAGKAKLIIITTVALIRKFEWFMAVFVTTVGFEVVRSVE